MSLRKLSIDNTLSVESAADLRKQTSQSLDDNHSCHLALRAISIVQRDQATTTPEDTKNDRTPNYNSTTSPRAVAELSPDEIAKFRYCKHHRNPHNF